MILFRFNNLTEENIKRWRRQCRTQYEDLSVKEKESDRVWADRVIKTITHHNYKELFADPHKNEIKKGCGAKYEKDFSYDEDGNITNRNYYVCGKRGFCQDCENKDKAEVKDG